MANLTKRDLVVAISNETGVVQSKVGEIVQLMLDSITDSLTKNKTVELRNFGVFEVRMSKERVGRNPKKPESHMKIPARATVRFKPGKIMKQRVLRLSKTLQAAGK
jgi:nucleoid DNA-binding protein